MKFKLSYKIFVAFSLTSLMVVALMVGIIRFYVTRNFADYVNKSLLERYSDVAAALATEHQTHKGWQTLKNNSGRWEEILRSSLPRKVFDLRRRSSQAPDIENKGSGGRTQDMPPPVPIRRIQRLARRLRFLMRINSISPEDVPGFHMTAIPYRKLRSMAKPQAG